MKIARKMVIALLYVALLSTGGAYAASVPKSILGTWTLNVAKSSFEGVPAAQNQTRVYENWGGGLIHATFEGTDREGKRTFTEYVARYDGRDYPRVVRGSVTAGTIALKRVDELR